jgi:hypothetical protein
VMPLSLPTYRELPSSNAAAFAKSKLCNVRP